MLLCVVIIKQAFKFHTLKTDLEQVKIQRTSGGIKGRGAWGAFPPHQRLCPPLAPQSEEKNGQNKLFSANFFDFCPLRIAFCPLDVPSQKNFWCRHCSVLNLIIDYLLKWGSFSLTYHKKYPFHTCTASYVCTQCCLYLSNDLPKKLYQPLLRFCAKTNIPCRFCVNFF